MSNTIVSRVTHRKRILLAVGLPVLVAAWWAFRPEKLFINQRVDEPAPFQAISGPQPLLTGPIEEAGHGAVGRATIYKTPAGGHYLRISGLSASAGQLSVVLIGAGAAINLGVLQNPSAENFDVPASVDLNQYDTVVIDTDHAGTFATAKLQPF